MSINTKQREAIEREAARFIREQSEELFARVDLRGMPHLYEKVYGKPDEGVDDRFAPLVGNEPYSKVGKSLREFLANPDEESLNAAAKYDPALRAQQLQKQGEREAIKFCRQNPLYYADPENHNYQAVVMHLAASKLPSYSFPDVESAQETLLQKGLFTAAHLSESFGVMWRGGALIPEPGTPRQLTESELHDVVAHASSWGVSDGIMTYMRIALGELPEDADNYQDVSDFLSRNSDLASEAVRFIFFSIEPVCDSDEFRGFEDVFFKDKRLRTYEMYKQCWSQYERQQRSASISRVLSEEPQAAPPDLDELNDDEVEQVMRQTVRARAKATCRAARVLA